MIVQYDPDLLKKLQKVDVRIRKSFFKKIKLFEHNPHELQLNNHALKREYKGYRSITITSDWRAIYEDITEEDEKIAYFLALGTREELYK